jgi:hypothetical protein
MAVEDKYVVTDESDVMAANANGAGSLRRMIVSFEVAAADDDGSVYRIAQIPAHSIITNVQIANDAITGGNDYDIGFYGTDYGAVVDVDELADGLDLSSAHVSGSELSGISAVDVANRGKQVYDLLGLTAQTRAEAYDLAVTANTAGSAAGTVTVIVDYIAV